MRVLLWPDGSAEEHRKELSSALGGEAVSTLPTATLVAASEDGVLMGFLEAGLRSHADGCDTAQPVGFVEGWFVYERARGQAVGKELMRAAQDWARSQGCREMASDALIDNESSIHAHVALGFEIVDRCVHFRKSL
jgi:aminoglycoside 6'-N-acetyltransferase I